MLTTSNHTSYPKANSERISDTHYIHRIPAVKEDHLQSKAIEFAIYDDPELPTYLKEKGSGSWMTITKTQWNLIVALYEHHTSPTIARNEE